MKLTSICWIKDLTCYYRHLQQSSSKMKQAETNIHHSLHPAKLEDTIYLAFASCIILTLLWKRLQFSIFQHKRSWYNTLMLHLEVVSKERRLIKCRVAIIKVFVIVSLTIKRINLLSHGHYWLSSSKNHYHNNYTYSLIIAIPSPTMSFINLPYCHSFEIK